jgi:hypothetical protein
MAIAQAKLVRLESNLSHAFYQSYLMKAVGCERQFTDPDGTVRPPEVIFDREFQVRRLINGISQHIARVERSWHKALDALQKLRKDRRTRVVAPVHRADGSALIPAEAAGDLAPAGAAEKSAALPGSEQQPSCAGSPAAAAEPEAATKGRIIEGPSEKK